MTIGEDIVKIITNPDYKIRKYFKITDGQWEGQSDSMIDNIKLIKENGLKNIKEDYLTFILACAYAINGNNGCHSLEKLLCEGSLHDFSEDENYHIWFQALPLKGKSSPKLDLSFGNISRPIIDNSQIVYNPPQNRNGRICFVEMKTGEDLRTSSTGNPKYNQLAKYIRSALIFQKAGIFPEEVHVTLVTPRIFKKKPKSRLYGYKFIEYACPEINPDNIINDIELPIENEEIEDDWIKCDKGGMNERLLFLQLHWIPYEDILDAVPENPLKDYIKKISTENPVFDKASGV